MWEELRTRLDQAQANGDIGKVVQDFLTTRVPESTVLDYKWKIDLTNSSHKVKLAKWVAGLANTRGGILLLGVKEDGDTGEPDHTEPLHPVALPPNIELVQQITNVVNGLVHPRPMYDVFPIPASDGQAAAIYVPASPNRPHVVQHGDEHSVPIRRGTSTVSAGREELDQLYVDRLATRTSLEQVARQQYHRYLPATLKSVPNVFIYATPVGTQANLVSLQDLREGQAYQKKLPGAPGWGGGHRLRGTTFWKGSPEAAVYDYPEDSREDTEYRAVAYKHGAIAAWSLLSAPRWASRDKEADFILPEAFMAALHGTMAPWLSYLRNLGLTAIVEGVVLLNNVTNHCPRFGPSFDLSDEFRSHRFEGDPVPISFTAVTAATHDQIIDICFQVFADMMYAAGHTTDFSKRDNQRFYSSMLEKQLLRR